jgi:hypothetical protein
VEERDECLDVVAEERGLVALEELLAGGVEAFVEGLGVEVAVGERRDKATGSMSCAIIGR